MTGPIVARSLTTTALRRFAITSTVTLLISWPLLPAPAAGQTWRLAHSQQKGNRGSVPENAQASNPTKSGSDDDAPDQAVDAPPNLRVSGSYRVRYEAQDGRYRAGETGSDQILVERLLLAVEYKFGDVFVGAELQDSRAQLADAGTPLGTDDSNAFELLQAHLGYSGEGVLMPGDRLRARLGRVTIDGGSRRLVARNAFRNTISAFTGLDVEWSSASGYSAHAFYTLPVDRRPRSAATGLLDNEVDLDEESTRQRFWGVFLAKEDWLLGAAGQVYLVGLQEKDRPEVPTLNRNLFTPGWRLLRAPEKGSFDFDWESTLQFGKSSPSTAANAARLAHTAHFHHAEIGYTWDHSWSPRVAVQFDFASGDSDPGDGRNGRFDTLFGARRWEFGPTGIFGFIQRSNLISPGLRVEGRPNSRLRLLGAYRPAFLAQSRDAIVTAGVQDVSGASGRFAGQQIEGELRFDVLPGNVRFETGFAYLEKGRFLEQAPNAPDLRDVIYGFSQLTLSF